jgi:hypothetical protein
MTAEEKQSYEESLKESRDYCKYIYNIIFISYFFYIMHVKLKSTETHSHGEEEISNRILS